MKFKYLEIQNFRAITKVVLEELEDIVLIAGPNGVGKSSIFDAIRLLKSSYGGYDQNEWHNWFNEFQVPIGGEKLNIEKVLSDKNKPLIISTIIELSESEIDYLENNGKDLFERMLWKSYTNNAYDPVLENPSGSFAKNYRQFAKKVKEETESGLKSLKEQIKSNRFEGYLEFSSDKAPQVKENITLELIFSTYDPEKLGIIDYHGAHRNYQKENISNINIQFDQQVHSQKGYSLYNYTNKYNNVKTEMASSYIKALLMRESGQEVDAVNSLNSSLQYLFEKFFPGKKFNGIEPTKEGKLEFPVILENGNTHDITELSSGEKEVIFGYLRLRNQSPKNSVILIDEPELHLNPRLAKQLPEFYYQTIGQELGNQIWLVTHSDSILRESVGLHGFSIYHMIENSADVDNQVRKISIKKDIEAALIDLIGDLSSYQQGNKVVIFEGAESDFDKRVTNLLFPEFEKKINSISAGSKTNVKNLQDVLKKAAEEGIINKKFISIVDKDSDKRINELSTTEYSWDVYHIENYLLEEKYIFQVLSELDILKKNIKTIQEIETELKKIAESTMEFHVMHALNEFVEVELKNSITTRIIESYTLTEGLFIASQNSMENIKTKLGSNLSHTSLKKMSKLTENKLQNSLKTDKWKKEYRGREILKRFVGKHAEGIRYEQFRNLIISRMKIDGFQPEGMKKVIKKILQS